MNTLTPFSPSQYEPAPRLRYRTIPATPSLQRYEVHTAYFLMGDPAPITSRIIPIEATSRARAMRAARQVVEDADKTAVVTSTVIL